MGTGRDIYAICYMDWFFSLSANVWGKGQRPHHRRGLETLLEQLSGRMLTQSISGRVRKQLFFCGKPKRAPHGKGSRRVDKICRNGEALLARQCGLVRTNEGDGG